MSDDIAALIVTIAVVAFGLFTGAVIIVVRAKKDGY